MKREEFVRRLVLDKICDDYENLDQTILSGVTKDGAECGLIIERSEVVDGLAQLIEQGLAKAYLLSCTEPRVELEGMPPPDVVDDEGTYFLATRKGIDLQVSGHSWWPWDGSAEEPGVDSKGGSW